MPTAIIDEFVSQLAVAVADELEKRKSDDTKKESLSKFMNKTQTCEYIGCAPSTLDRWIKNRNFPLSKVGGKYVYSRQEVDQWIKENTK